MTSQPLLPLLLHHVSHLQQQVWSGCLSLQGSPPELYKTFWLKFLDSYSYFSTSVILTLFLTTDFGYSDMQAGTIYGAWGALITVYGLATGFVVDNLGVSASVRIGFVISFMARCFLFLTTSRTFLLFNLCGLLPLGNCLGIPVLTIGIRRYTTESNRGFAFGLFYVVMNVAALLSGPMVDLCTKTLYHASDHPDTDTKMDPDTGEPVWTLTGYRMVLLSCIIANLLAVLVSFSVREIKLKEDPPVFIRHNKKNGNAATVDATESTTYNDDPLATNTTDEDIDNSSQKTPVSMDLQRDTTIATFTPLRGSAWAILQETMQTKTFWRYLAVIMITLNIRMIFRHLDATLPKYMIREFGDNVPYGTIYSINPALIMLLVPIVTAATSHVDPLVMIHYGTYVSAASVFFLVFSTSIWACILFVTVLSIGEATWSPRLYDYTMSVCPEGREGTYGALASAPLFLAKLPVGFMSGYLLQNYCPAQGPRHSKHMWLIIAVTTAVSPLLMTMCWKFISHKDTDEGPSTGKDVRYTELATAGAPGQLGEEDYDNSNGADEKENNDGDDEAHSVT